MAYFVCLVLLALNVLLCSSFLFPRLSRPTLPPLFQKLQFESRALNISNAPGNLFVDPSCIDCDACRWIAPSIFERVHKRLTSTVYRQPETSLEKLKAYSAMHACPVNAIRMKVPDPFAEKAASMFPLEINKEKFPNVHHCGFHALESYGTTPYIICRSSGNVMIDCPRFDARLADTIEKEGGISSMIFTHKTSVADHALWKERFPEMERIIHVCDMSEEIRDIEIQLQGFGVWNPDSDIDIIYTPGHTAGHLCVLYRSPVEPVLFSGDHLSFSLTENALTGWKAKNRGTTNLQYKYMRELSKENYNFLWILPAHGRMIGFSSLQEKKEALLAASDIFRVEDERFRMLDSGYY